MNDSDLTPRAYHLNCQTRTAKRRWLLAAFLSACIAAASVAVELADAPDHAATVARERLAQAQTRLVQSQALSGTIKGQLNQQERELQAGIHLTRRPDWADVLGRVASQFDQQIVMTGFRLGPLSDGKVKSALGPIAQDVPAESVWLILSGVAQGNRDVPGLILRLEKMGIFERVVMTGAQRQAFAGSPRTAFVLACLVD